MVVRCHIFGIIITGHNVAYSMCHKKHCRFSIRLWLYGSALPKSTKCHSVLSRYRSVKFSKGLLVNQIE